MVSFRMIGGSEVVQVDVLLRRDTFGLVWMRWGPRRVSQGGLEDCRVQRRLTFGPCCGPTEGIANATSAISVSPVHTAPASGPGVLSTVK